jgi:membrane protein
MRIMTFIAQQFLKGGKPPARPEMSTSLGVPSQLASQVLGSLLSAKLLVEVAGDDGGYVPSRPLDKITVEDILHSLRVGQGHELATRDEPVRAIIRAEYERILLAEMQTAGAVSLQSLATRAQSLPPQEAKSVAVAA